MTKTEAIGVIKEFVAYGKHVNAFVYKGSTSIPIDALNMAIEALEQEPIIRCKDCRHIELKDFVRGTCKYRTGEVMPDSYCEKGRTK